MNETIKQSTSLQKKWLAIGLVGSLIAAGAWYVTSERGPFYTFNDAYDMQDVLTIFDKNWYWLLAGPDSSPSFMMSHRAPSPDPAYIGKLQTKVLREDGRRGPLIGFTSYYLMTPTIGRVLFVAVDEAFRNKGYGEKLLRYATDDLRKQGMQKARLSTRVQNISAQNLYKKFGFKEIHRDSAYIDYDYEL